MLGRAFVGRRPRSAHVAWNGPSATTPLPWRPPRVARARGRLSARLLWQGARCRSASAATHAELRLARACRN